MAAKAIESAQINVNNNEVTVTLKLKEMTIYGQTASVDKMEYQLTGNYFSLIMLSTLLVIPASSFSF